MSRERKPTRLDLHRAQFHRFKKMTSTIALDVLSEDEKKLISDDFMERVRVEAHRLNVSELNTEVYYRLYAETLGDWGVMCPHPPDKRKYGSLRDPGPHEDIAWFACSMCNCAVINQEFIRKRNAQTEKDGRSDGSEQRRVPGS